MLAARILPTFAPLRCAARASGATSPSCKTVVPSLHRNSSVQVRDFYAHSSLSAAAGTSSSSSTCSSLARRCHRRGSVALAPLLRCRIVAERNSAVTHRVSHARRGMASQKARPEGGAAKRAGAAGETATKTQAGEMSFVQWWLAPKPMPPRNTLRWYGEVTLICTVFAITGSSTMFLVRPAVSEVLGLKGSWRDGPWSYRICSLVIMTPIYSSLLVVVGTVFGRHAYFRHFSAKMFSRFGVPPEMIEKNFHATAKTFKKW